MKLKQESRSLRVLIIEDNKDLTMLLCSLLELMGHNAVAAHSGTEGIEKAKEEKPDIIICDIGLPGIDGYEVAKNIRSDDILKDVHLIALTGYVSANDVDYAVKAGFNRHLAKPIELNTLQSVLSEEIT